MAYVFRRPPPIFRPTLAQRSLATMTVTAGKVSTIVGSAGNSAALGSANAMVL